MEDLGSVKVQYQVFKSSGLFARGTKILQICEQGCAFLNPNFAKSKDRECFPFSEGFEIERGVKEITVKTKRQNFSLVVSLKDRLITDLYYYKDLYDFNYNITPPYKSAQVEGFRQVVPSDPSTKLPVSIRLFRSALLISYDDHHFLSSEGSPKEQSAEIVRKPRKYPIFYQDITRVLTVPNGAVFETTEGVQRFIFEESAISSTLERLQDLPDKFLGRPLLFQTETIYIPALFSAKDSFAVPLMCKMPGGLRRDLRAHFDAFIAFEDSSTGCLVSLADLGNMQWIAARIRPNKSSLLQIGMLHGKTLKLHLTNEALGLFVAEVFQWKMDSETAWTPLLLDIPSEGSFKIHCDPETEVDPGFEASLVKEVEEGLGAAGKMFDGGIFEGLINAAVNVSFKATGYDQKLLSFFTTVLSDLVPILNKLESDPASVQDYQKIAEAPSKEIFAVKSSEPTLSNVYSRLAPILNLLRNLLSQRGVAPDLPLYAKLFELLLTVAKSENPVVSFSASLCLRAMFKLLRTEKRLESAKKWIIRELDVINSLCAGLSFRLSKPLVAPALGLYGLLSVFSITLADKKDGLLPEDVKYIIGTILAQSHILDLLESLLCAESKPVQYEVCQVQSKALGLCFVGIDVELFHAYQSEILHSTVLFALHLKNLFGSTSPKISESAAQCAALQLIGNPEGCELIARIFPAEIIHKEPLERDVEKWKAFFAILKKDCNTPTEQWGAECREELVGKLAAVIDGYMTAKGEAKRLGNKNGVRWNIEEVEVKYASLEEKCRVGGFYLKNIVKVAVSGAGNKVELTTSIPDPKSFWTKLVNKYLISTDLPRKKLILSVMRAIYKEYCHSIFVTPTYRHHKSIQKVKAIPHFVHELSDCRYKSLHLLVLKLLYGFVKIKDHATAFANYKQLLKENGIPSMLGVFSVPFHKPKNVRKCLTVLKIFRKILSSIHKPFLYPEAKILEICKYPASLRLISNLLLSQHESLTNATITFVSDYLTGTQIDCKTTGLADFLVSILDTPSGKPAFSLLHKLQQKAGKNYNADLDLSGLSAADKDIVGTGEKISGSLFLRYLPVPFVRMIAKEQNAEKAFAIFVEDNHREPELVWGGEMRAELMKELRSYTAPFAAKLRGVDKEGGDAGCYETPYKKVMKYPQLENEIRSGEYYLTATTQSRNSIETSQNSLMESIEKTLSEISADLEHVDFEKMDVVISSMKASIKTLGKKFVPSTIIAVLLQVAPKMRDNLETGSNRTYLKNVGKFLVKVIKTGAALTPLEENCCHSLAGTVLKKWLGCLKGGVNVIDASGIKWFVMLLHDLTEKSVGYWDGLEKGDRAAVLKGLFDFAYHCTFRGSFLTTSKAWKKSTQVLQNPPQRKSLNRLLALSQSRYSVFFPIVFAFEKHHPGIDSAIKLTKYPKSAETSNLYRVYALLAGMETAFGFANLLSVSSDHSAELLKTGWAWLSLYQAVQGPLSKSAEFLEARFALSSLKPFNLLVFRHLAAFAYKAKPDMLDPSSTDPAKTEILQSFTACVNVLLSRYILNHILNDAEISGNQVKEPGIKSVLGSMQQICEKLRKDIELPHFIWNASTQTELAGVLREEIMGTVSKEPKETFDVTEKLRQFQYKSYENELIVDGVFVRVINKDPYMRIEDPFAFVGASIAELGKSSIEELAASPKTAEKAGYLLDAVNNIVIYQKGLDGGVLSPAGIKTLCQFVTVQAPTKATENLTSYAYSILLEAAKDVKQAVALTDSNDFVRSILAPVCRVPAGSVTDLKRALNCIESLSNHKDCDIPLVTKGFVLILLRLTFDDTLSRAFRILAFKSAQGVLMRQKAEDRVKVFSLFIPPQLVERILEQVNVKEEEWIDLFSGDRTDIYLVWDQSVKSKVKEGLVAETRKIEQWIGDAADTTIWIDWPKADMIGKHVNKGEVVVSEIVLSRYIASPFVKLRKPIGKLIEGLQEGIMRHLIMINQHVSFHGMDIRETIGGLEEVKESANIHIANVEKAVLSMITALLLTYEQMFKNLFNQSKIGSDSHSPPRKSVTGIRGLVGGDTIKAMLYQGLRGTICREINIMLLELLYLVCEQKDVLGKDELQVITVAVTQRLLECSTKTGGTDQKLRKVEEVTIMAAIMKILDRAGHVKGQDPIFDLIVTKEILAKLKELYAVRGYLAGYVEVLLHRVCHVPYYQKVVADDWKFELSAECKMERIVNKKYEPVDKFWRRPPVKLEECKLYESHTVMEDYDPASGTDNVMPIVSKKVFEKVDFEDSSKVLHEMYGEIANEFKPRVSEPTFKSAGKLSKL